MSFRSPWCVLKPIFLVAEHCCIDPGGQAVMYGGPYPGDHPLLRCEGLSLVHPLYDVNCVTRTVPYVFACGTNSHRTPMTSVSSFENCVDHPVRPLAPVSFLE